MYKHLVVTSERLNISHPVAIGSGAKEFADKLKSLRDGGDPFGRKTRLPLLAVEALVATDIRKDVGGDIQLGYATSRGFQIFCRTRPVVPGRPQARMTFLWDRYE
jgi:hypothetical protein